MTVNNDGLTRYGTKRNPSRLVGLKPQPKLGLPFLYTMNLKVLKMEHKATTTTGSGFDWITGRFRGYLIFFSLGSFYLNSWFQNWPGARPPEV